MLDACRSSRALASFVLLLPLASCSSTSPPDVARDTGGGGGSSTVPTTGGAGGGAGSMNGGASGAGPDAGNASGSSSAGSSGSAGNATPPIEDASAPVPARDAANGSLVDVSREAARAEASTARAEAATIPPDAGSVVTPPSGNVTCGTTYKNTLRALTHDPSPIVKEGDTYYLYGTCQTALLSSPGCGSSPKMSPFQTSTDLVNWRAGGNAMSAVPAWANQLGLVAAPDIWAPDVHVVNGKAYLYYSVSAWGDVTHSAVGLMTNTTLNPAASGYQWIDQGKVVGAPEGGSGVNVIDSSLFIDDDARWWLAYGSFHSGVRVIELDPATGKAKLPITPATVTSGLGEGVSLIKNNGYYYLAVSTGSCCNGLSSTYQIVYGRATKPTGPYLNRTGGSINTASERLLPPGSDGNPGQGGQSFFKDNNQFYMVYHAYQPPNGDPTLNIRPIYFDANDWITLDACMAKGYKP